MKSTRGVIQLWVLYVIGAAIATQLVPNWRLNNLFAKGPPTAALRAAEDAAVKARADAVKAQADAAAAVAALEAAKAEGAKIHAQQGAYAQGAAAGAAEALARVPGDHQTPEVKVASALVDRSRYALDSAFGQLSPGQAAQWKALTDAALAAQGAEIATLKAALADKDAALQVTIKEKAVLAVKVPALEDQAKAAAAKADVAQATATTKTQEAAGLAEKVAVVADKLAAKEKETGSLGATLTRWFWGAAILGGIIVFCNWILPSLAAEFPAVSWLVKLNKTTKSISSAHP